MGKKEACVKVSRQGSERSSYSRRRNSSNRVLSQAEKDNRSRQLNPKDRLYQLSRGVSDLEHQDKDWRTLMDEVSASRIQSHADKIGRNQDFKSRAQSAADRNKQE